MDLDVEKRILGLDIGTKRTGVAISDPSHSIALPIRLIEAEGKKRWLEAVAEIMDEYTVDQIVVGIPLNQDGEAARDALKIREFIALLRERFSASVVEWDERFTTVQAERSLIDADLSRSKRKFVVDKVAATILLQTYLDSLRFRENSPCPEY